MKHVLALLLCVLSAAPAAAQRGTPVQIGDFWLQRSVDPMTDEERAVLLVSAAESDYFQPALFGWVCSARGLEAGFTPGRYLGAAGATVQFRFDRETPSEPEPWVPGSDERFVFLPQEYLRGFTARAMAASRLVVRAWDAGSDVYTFTFSMQGLTRGLRRLPCAAWVFEDR
jgi:hypothetical protein